MNREQGGYSWKFAFKYARYAHSFSSKPPGCPQTTRPLAPYRSMKSYNVPRAVFRILCFPGLFTSSGPKARPPHFTLRDQKSVRAGWLPWSQQSSVWIWNFPGSASSSCELCVWAVYVLWMNEFQFSYFSLNLLFGAKWLHLTNRWHVRPKALTHHPIPQPAWWWQPENLLKVLWIVSEQKPCVLGYFKPHQRRELTRSVLVFLTGHKTCWMKFGNCLGLQWCSNT